MIRILLIILLIVVIFAMLGKYHRKKVAMDKNKRKLVTSKMVKCMYCGVYVPRQESVAVNDVYYCSKEHHKLADPTNDHSS